jgi:Ser/Thr protein kinase RdoA (MazF antagonist)
MTELEAVAVASDFGVEVGGAHAVAMRGGYSNENVRIDAASGSVVVRRYGRLHVTRAAIRFEHAVAAHAAARMPEIVAPLRSASGETIALAPDGGLAAVLPYIEGETGRRDPATAAAAARVLARFHAVTCDLHVTGGLRTARFLGTLPLLRARFATFAEDRLLARALDWSALIAAVSTSATRIANRAPALPPAIVHGDLNPGNVVSGASATVRGLIDFDFVHETERIYDLGVLVDEFARADDDAPLDDARIAEIVDAYASEAPLTPDERALLADAMLRHAATLVWYVVTRHGERVPGDVGGAHRYAARVGEIDAARGAIRAAARG